MFPFAFSHKKGQCPKDLLLAGKWDALGRLPVGRAPPGLLFPGRMERVCDHLPTSCVDDTQYMSGTRVFTQLGYLLAWHLEWQGSLPMFGWEQGRGPSSKHPRPQVDLLFLQSEHQRGEPYRAFVHPSPRPPSHSKEGYWETSEAETHEISTGTLPLRMFLLIRK